MILYNYSSLRSGDSRIYSVAGTKVSSTGISTLWLKVIGAAITFGILVGILICIVTGRNFFNPLGPYFSLKFICFTIGGGLGLGLLLWYMRIETYRLYEYLIAYIKPKKTYHNMDTRNKEFKLYKIKENGLIKNIL